MKIRPFASLAVASVMLLFFAAITHAQNLSSIERETGRTMLNNIKTELKKNYYDPNFKGINIDEQFKAADEKIKTATSNGQIFGIIEQTLMKLDDSHTFFSPPSHSLHIDYGWRLGMVGDTCYIQTLKPGSDAEAKGLKPGDILHVIDGYKVTKDNLWLLQYLFNVLQPKQSVQVVVQSPNDQPRQVQFNAATKQTKKVLDLTSGTGMDYNDLIREFQDDDRVNEHRYVQYADQLMIWKLPQFDMTDDQVHAMMDKAEKYKTLVIDVRDNPGGYVDSLLLLLGNLFDHDIKLGDLKRRKETKPQLAKTRNHNIYKGNVIVLVNHNSASASEFFARVIQLEKRGTVIGDISEGAALQSRHYYLQVGVDTIVPYSVSISEADIIMADGKSLEHVGVIPDKLMLPTGADMRAGLDPVLAYAASQAGVTLTPEAAGSLFPVRWRTAP